jgi:hypothetical protein
MQLSTDGWTQVFVLRSQNIWRPARKSRQQEFTSPVGAEYVAANGASFHWHKSQPRLFGSPDGALNNVAADSTRMSPCRGCCPERGCGEAQPQHVEFTNAFEMSNDATVLL